MVLEALLQICKNPQTLVDIFLNYDCDVRDPRDIYERMVNDLSGIAKVILRSEYLRCVPRVIVKE
jgi:brefeldin A-inhibited guanine nucleotide-exchange protein